MALIALNVGRGVVAGISIDTHAHRIADRLGWTRAARDPEATRLQLEAWVPREHWSSLNLLLVGFGQQVCQPQQPKCAQCTVSHLCPVGRKTVKL
jgi:endonuclease-3